jgi:hypothetical protein
MLAGLRQPSCGSTVHASSWGLVFLYESVDRFSRLAQGQRELPETVEQYSLLVATQVPEIEHHCQR